MLFLLLKINGNSGFAFTVRNKTVLVPVEAKATEHKIKKKKN